MSRKKKLQYLITEETAHKEINLQHILKLIYQPQIEMKEEGDQGKRAIKENIII